MGANVASIIARLSHSEAISALEPIVMTMVNNCPIQDPFPSFVPSPEQYKATYDAFRAVHQEALTGNHVKIAERNATRLTLNQQTVDLADFVELASRKDASVMIRSGFDYFRRTYGSAPPVAFHAIPGAAASLQAKHGPERGTIILKATGITGAKSYDVWITDGDPTVEKNWRHFEVFGTSRMVLKNLEPGRLYSFRVRGIGGAESGPWSHYISLMAI